MAPANPISAIASRRLARNVSASGFVCLQCRLHSSITARKQFQLSLPIVHSRQYATFTDRVRKKIWGSENPPGQEDPYGGQSILDQRKTQAELEDDGKGPRSQVASTAEELRDENTVSGYVAKTTWDGLERVGYEGWGNEEWNKEYPFEGYMNPKKTDRHEVIAAIHRALVEIYTLKHEGLPLAMDYFAFDLDDDYARRLAEGSTFESDPHGETRVVLESEELRRQILESTKPKDDTTDDTLPQPELAAEEYTERQDVDDDLALMPERDHASPSIKRDEVEAEAELPAGDDSIDDAPEVGRYHILGGEYQIKPANDSWRNIALDDSQVKFAVLKRVMQLTGARIPDPDITNITNTKALFGHLVRRPKIKKLAESLMIDRIAELPNVQIVDRRYTPIDKEKEVGRWKIIEKELIVRDLPITGDGTGSRAATVAS